MRENWDGQQRKIAQIKQAIENKIPIQNCNTTCMPHHRDTSVFDETYMWIDT